MKAKELRANLVRCKKVTASARSRIVVLTSVRFDAFGMHATDMTARLTIPFDTGLDRAYHVDPTLAGKALKGLRAGDDVTLVGDGAAGLRINGVRLPDIADPGDWPELPADAFGAAGSYRLPEGSWDMIREVAAAAVGTDESRPVLCAVQVRWIDGRMRVAATDSYRLAHDELPCDTSDMPEAREVMLPANGGKYLAAIHDADRITVGPVYTRLEASDGSTLDLRRVEGQYPNVDQLVTTSEGVASVDAPGLLASADMAASMTGGPVAMTFNGDCRIESTSTDPCAPEYGETLACDWEGEEVRIGVNAGYLRDALKFVGPDAGDKADRVNVGLIGPLRPLLLGEQDKAGRFYLLMPVRLAA